MKDMFAPTYPRDEFGKVLFPRDTVLRRQLFPYTDPQEHVAKANMLMVKELVEFVSEPGELILDPFAGTGTIMVACTIGRRVTMIEIEEVYCGLIELNLIGVRQTVKDADELVTLIPGNNNNILPIYETFDHMIFSPPYSNLLRKSKAVEKDKTSVDLGYAKAADYSSDPENTSNLNDFMYYQKMDNFYKKCFTSLKHGGTMTVIIKDRMEAGKRIFLGKRAERDCLRIGFKLVAWNKWYAPGGGYSALNKSKGLETVDEEDLLTFRKEMTI